MPSPANPRAFPNPTPHRGTRAVPHCLTLLILAALPLVAADSPLVFSRTYGGAALDAATAIAADRAGFVILAGSTSSYDFPVTNHSRNTGTQFAVTTDDGRTWSVLSNLPTGTPSALLADPSAPHTWYAGGTSGIFRSTDDGLTWQNTLAPDQPACNIIFSCGVISFAASAAQPGTVYALTVAGARKSTDSGATWVPLPLPGDPAARPYYLAQHPTQPNRIFAGLFTGGLYEFQSFDGGKSWSSFAPPLLHPSSSCFSGILFDRTDPNRFYLSDHCDVFRTTDNGQTYQPLNMPSGTYSVTPDPVRPDTLYAAGGGLYRSTDGGQTWSPALTNSQGSFNYVITDPTHPATAFAGGYVTFDHGETFAGLPLGRSLTTIAFDPRNATRAIAIAPDATSGFVMRLNSAGDILASTYFGGQGITKITGAATDAEGNFYLTGVTSSPDYPVTSGAFLAPPRNPAIASQRTLAFVTKFSPDLEIVYSAVVSRDNLQAASIAVDPDGAAVIAGTLYTTSATCSIAKLNPDGSELLFSKSFGSVRGYTLCNAVAAASNRQTVAAGSTQDPDFPVAGVGVSTSLKGNLDAILLRLDPAGNLLDSSLIGGAAEDTATAIALDAAGNIYLAGTTASKDFPVSENAFQSALRSNCTYPSSAIATGFIGTITTFRTDDAFVAKFDPAGNRIFSTYLGGDCYDQARAIAVDSADRVWIAGYTNSSPFPQAMPFESGPAAPLYKAFVTELDENGQRVILSSYTSAGEQPVLALDSSGSVYIGGSTLTPPSPYSAPGPPVIHTGHAYLAKVQTQFPFSVSLRSIGNAFSLRSGPVSPSQITLITADGILPDQSIDLGFSPSAPLPRSLAGVQVLFDGEPAPLVSVAPGRVVCVAPNSLAGKTWVAVQVVSGSARSDVQLTEVTPDRALLTLDGSGRGQAYARNADGTLNSKDNPAAKGSTVTLFLTGAGSPGTGCPEGGVAPATAPPVPVSGLMPIPGSLCGFYQMLVTAPPTAGEVTPMFGTGITFVVR